MTTHTLSTKPGDAASPDLCSLDPTELSVIGMSVIGVLSDIRASSGSGR